MSAGRQREEVAKFNKLKTHAKVKKKLCFTIAWAYLSRGDYAVDFKQELIGLKNSGLKNNKYSCNYQFLGKDYVELSFLIKEILNIWNRMILEVFYGQ